MSNLRQAAQQALEALKASRRSHHYCEDPWYSCPKHEDGCANKLDGDECNCGADEENEKIDQAITALRAALAEPDSDYERGFVDGMNLQTKGSVDKAVNRMAQTTHWKGCEAVHPECRKPEPVAWRTFDGEGGYDYRTYEDNENYRDEYIKRNGEKYASWVEPLYTAPPEAVEPIAWMVYTEGGASAYVTDSPNDLVGAYRALPLFTAPTPRKPLTDEELDKVFPAIATYLEANKALYRSIARAIERAHGIQGKK